MFILWNVPMSSNKEHLRHAAILAPLGLMYIRFFRKKPYLFSTMCLKIESKKVVFFSFLSNRVTKQKLSSRPAAPDAGRFAALACDPERWRARRSLVHLAGCKSLSGKRWPPTRSECCACGGVLLVRANKTGEAYTKNHAGRRGNRVCLCAGIASKWAFSGRRGSSCAPKAIQDHLLMAGM